MICRAIGKPRKHVLVGALIAKAPVEALDESVPDRLFGRDVVPSDAAFLLPVQDGVRSQFGAVVADDHQRVLRGRDDDIELARHRSAGDRHTDNQRQALTGEVVDNDEHPKTLLQFPATVADATVDKPTPRRRVLGKVWQPRRR